MSGSLVHSAEDIVRRLLIQLGLGTSPSAGGSWPVHATREPDLPDNCITVYGTTGVGHGRDMTSGETQEHEGIQIRVRSATPDGGATKANAIARSLDISVANTGVTVSSSTYTVHSINKVSGPIAIGTEAGLSKRTIHTINYTVALSQTS